MIKKYGEVVATSLNWIRFVSLFDNGGYHRASATP